MIAFRLSLEGAGWNTYQPGPADSGRVMVLPGCPYEIRRDLIPTYFAPDVLSLMQIWVNWHLGLGLPMSGGWLEQPGYMSDALDIMIAIAEQHEARQRERAERGFSGWQKTGSRSRSLPRSSRRSRG